MRTHVVIHSRVYMWHLGRFVKETPYFSRGKHLSHTAPCLRGTLAVPPARDATDCASRCSRRRSACWHRSESHVGVSLGTANGGARRRPGVPSPHSVSETRAVKHGSTWCGCSALNSTNLSQRGSTSASVPSGRRNASSPP